MTNKTELASTVQDASEIDGVVNGRVRRQFVVWSFDEASSQSFCDIVMARASREAERRVERMRPCAVMDAYCKPIPLTDYIAYLQTQLTSANTSTAPQPIDAANSEK